MKIGTNDISKIMLGGSEITSIYLGTSQVYSGGDTPTPPTPTPTPSTDAPLDNAFAVKVTSEGRWFESFDDQISSIDDIETFLEQELGLQPSDIEELVIGNNTDSISLDGSYWDNCTGLTLAPNVSHINAIYRFQAMEWVNVMGTDLQYDGVYSLFSDMNCCPVYVPEDYLVDYQMRWSSQETMDCQGSVADRLVGWNNPDEIGTGE